MSDSIRNERLAEISKMVINGEITYKLDQIATIYINDRHYFNVFRRYNSPYNIVIEDNNTDIYFHQDRTVRTSLKNILCLPDCESSNMYTWNAISYQHNGPVPNMSIDIADMRWTEIQAQYQAVNVNFSGIFDRDPLMSTHIHTIPVATNATQEYPIKAEVAEAAKAYTSYTLLTVSIPIVDDSSLLCESDGPTLSMRLAYIQKIANERISRDYQMDSDSDADSYDSDNDSDSDYDNDSQSNSSDSDDNINYIELRSGNRISKPVS